MIFESEILLLRSYPNAIITKANSVSSMRVSSQDVCFPKRVRKILNDFYELISYKAIKLNEKPCLQIVLNGIHTYNCIRDALLFSHL